MKEMVEWKDVESFIRWYFEDDHNFDVFFYKSTGELDGFVDVGTHIRYTHRELFDYWIKYVKQ